jgi:hypothetical protein
MTLSPSMRAQLRRVNDQDGVLLLVRIDSPDLSGPVRVVADNRDWRINGEDFVALPLDITLPQDVPKESARAQIEMDNIGRAMMAELEGLPMGATLDVTLQIVSRAALDVIEWEFTAAATKARTTTPRVVLSLGDDWMFGQSAVLLRADPTTMPGIFAG